MAGKYFNKEDIRKMMTEKVKGYLDQGWYFNFHYMRCSNGYGFAAVTDGKDTVVIYISSVKAMKRLPENYSIETYVIVNGYDSRERFKKHCERMHNRTDFNNKAISEPMKEVLAKYIKKQGIPGLKRFKVSDMDGYYSFRQNKYILEIKGRRVIINRDWYVVMAI